MPQLFAHLGSWGVLAAALILEIVNPTSSQLRKLLRISGVIALVMAAIGWVVMYLLGLPFFGEVDYFPSMFVFLLGSASLITSTKKN